jgi:hypothetical protein
MYVKFIRRGLTKDENDKIIRVCLGKQVIVLILKLFRLSKYSSFPNLKTTVYLLFLSPEKECILAIEDNNPSNKMSKA